MSRIDRVQEELRHHVSQIVQQELNDPRIGLVTITRVEVNPDLREARVFFTTIDPEESLEAAVERLNASRGFVRKLIGERIRMKFTPQINFIYDDSLEKQGRIDDIIEKIHEEEGEKI